MRTATTVMFITLLAVGLAWLTGCNDDNNTMHTNQLASAPQILSVSPPSGASDVSPRDSVHMRFDMPMDTLSVRHSFHLAGGSEMQRWMDSLSHHQGMGGMGMMDMDHMMQWMDTMHVDGQFFWNTRVDSCTFVLDSSMMPDADHMIYMYEGIKGTNGRMMDMDTFTYGGYMHHFRTGP